MPMSFYYIVTYNIHHPAVKALLSDIITVCESLVELKTRSKLFHDFNEATEAATDDFMLKSKKTYPDSEHLVKYVMALNPLFDTENEPDPSIQNDWQDNCAGAIFFIEDDNEDDEEEIYITPSTWVFKYELFFIQDFMEVSVNGESLLDPDSMITTSSYH